MFPAQVLSTSLSHKVLWFFAYKQAAVEELFRFTSVNVKISNYKSGILQVQKYSPLNVLKVSKVILLNVQDVLFCIILTNILLECLKIHYIYKDILYLIIIFYKLIICLHVKSCLSRGFNMVTQIGIIKILLIAALITVHKVKY